jgi:hypothetical protein
MLPAFDDYGNLGRSRRGNFMTPLLTATGYAQTKRKLAQMEKRLAHLEGRPEGKPKHFDEVRRSYARMIGQYRREIKLYEANLNKQAKQGDPSRSAIV